MKENLAAVVNKKGKKKDSKELQAALRLLIKVTDGRLCLLAEEAKVPKVFLLVGKHGNGRLEYQVSDGMDGCRSLSFDHNCLSEAIETFDRVCKVGWRMDGGHD